MYAEPSPFHIRDAWPLHQPLCARLSTFNPLPDLQSTYCFIIMDRSDIHLFMQVVPDANNMQLLSLASDTLVLNFQLQYCTALLMASVVVLALLKSRRYDCVCYSAWNAGLIRYPCQLEPDQLLIHARHITLAYTNKSGEARPILLPLLRGIIKTAFRAIHHVGPKY